MVKTTLIVKRKVLFREGAGRGLCARGGSSTREVDGDLQDTRRRTWKIARGERRGIPLRETPHPKNNRPRRHGGTKSEVARGTIPAYSHFQKESTEVQDTELNPILKEERKRQKRRKISNCEATLGGS